MNFIPNNNNWEARAQRALALIRGCLTAVAQAKEEEPFLQEICRLLVDIGGYPLAWVGLAEQNASKKIRRVAHAGTALDLLELLPRTWSAEGPGRDPAGTAIRTGQMVFCPDIQSEPACADYAEVAATLGLTSCLALPLIHQCHLFGALTLYASSSSAFSADEQEILRTFTACFCQGLTTLHLKGELSRLEERLTEDLRETEENYRNIFNNAQVGVFRWRLSDGRLLECNDRLAQMFGYPTREDLLQEFVAQNHFVDPGTQNRLLESVKDGQLQNFETRFFRRDGAILWLLCSARVYADRDYMQGVATDITELRQAQDNLAQSEAQHRTMAEQLLGRTLLFAVEQQQVNKEIQREKDCSEKILGHCEDGVAGFDRDFHITLWNPSMEQLTGLPKAKALGKHLFMALPILQEFHEKSPILGAGGRQGFIDDNRLVKLSPQGPEGFYAGHVAPMLNEAGKVNGGVLLIRDLTALKRAENALEEQKGLLEGLMASAHEGLAILDRNRHKQTEEMCPQFEAQLCQARRLDAIGSLAGGIAHDFNNILGVMLGYTEMALMSLKEDDALKRRLQQVLKAGERGKELVAQILSFSRPSSQERRPAKISVIVKEALHMLQATLPTTIELKMRLAEDQDTILADATQMHQMISNLCAHAALAMRDQGGLLDISVGPVNLDAKAAAQFHGLSPGPYIRLRVKDSGPGMDRDTMERIFDPLFTTKKMEEGTGTSLAVAYSIIKAHGGAITVQSKVGQGSEFQIYLPRVEEAELPGDTEAPAVENGRERLLFVDDEEWLVDMWKEILESLGYRMTVTTRPLEALDMFNKSPQDFDLVIADYSMPQMTGLELAQELLAVRPELPIILVTGFSQVVSPEKARAAGVREFILKPLSISELTNAISQALGK